MSLTALAVANAKGKPKPYKLFDGGGLHLLVKPSGRRYWRLNYRFGGKYKTLALGTFPTVSLAAARTKRDEAKQLLREGTNRAVQRRLSAPAPAIEVGEPPDQPLPALDIGKGVDDERRRRAQVRRGRRRDPRPHSGSAPPDWERGAADAGRRPRSSAACAGRRARPARRCSPYPDRRRGGYRPRSRGHNRPRARRRPPRARQATDRRKEHRPHASARRNRRRARRSVVPVVSRIGRSAPGLPAPAAGRATSPASSTTPCAAACSTSPSATSRTAMPATISKKSST